MKVSILPFDFSNHHFPSLRLSQPVRISINIVTSVERIFVYFQSLKGCVACLYLSINRVLGLKNLYNILQLLGCDFMSFLNITENL